MYFQNAFGYALLCFIAYIKQTTCLDNGLALTPPMGWMSWERYRCTTDCVKYPDECISEKLFRNAADLLVSEGYAKKGYEYVIIDDCWLAHDRDANGNLQPDPSRFPSGIKNLSDYIHSKGLKFGIYEDYGTYTCGGYPGMLEHLEKDAIQMANWGVDYIKVDGCNVDINKMKEGYPEFGKYLNKTNRPIVYSCSWPAYLEGSSIKPDFKLIAETCNLWRNSYDIADSYDSVVGIADHFSDKQDIYAPNAGPGHWNDPDMLIIGNFGLSYEQSKMQMAIWAILAAPLIMSTDLKAMRQEYKEILQNEAVIAINQDPLGIQGRHILKENDINVWTRPITPTSAHNDYSYAIAIVSYRTDGMPYFFQTTPQKIGLNYAGGYNITDVFANKLVADNVKPEDKFSVNVNPTGVVFLRANIKK